ncbi:MAG: GDSL-type esterase/lipase family protein [Patescibacteria group bacterium]
MFKKTILIPFILLYILFVATTASAAVLYQNNFDSDTTGVIPADWVSTGGTYTVEATGNAISTPNAFGSTAGNWNDGNLLIYTGASAADTIEQYTQKSQISGGVAFGSVLRSSADGSTQYVILYYSNVAHFYKKVSPGGYQGIGTLPTPTINPGDIVTVKAAAIGNLIEFKMWVAPDSEPVSWTGSVSDSSISSSGYAGFYMTVGGVNAYVDDFSVSSVSNATTYTVQGPTTTPAGQASTNFVVEPDGAYTGTITPSDNGAGGSFSPTSLTFSGSAVPQSFTYTPASTGIKTISTTSSPGLTNPASVSVVVTAPIWSQAFTDTFNRADGAIGNNWSLGTGTSSISGNKLDVPTSSYVDGVAQRPLNEITTVNQRAAATYLTGSTGTLWMTLRTQTGGTEYLVGINSGQIQFWLSDAGALVGSSQVFTIPNYNSAHSYRLDISATGTLPTTLAATVQDIDTGITVLSSSVTDSTASLQQGGRVGFFAANGSVSLDDFTDYNYVEAVPATSYALAGPTTAFVNEATSSFTVTPDGTYTGTITPSDNGAGGSFSPTSLTFSNSSDSQTFTYTPTSFGSKTITTVSSPALTNPSSLHVNVLTTYPINDSHLYWSKDTVYVNGTAFASMVVPGAYLKTNFTGTSIKLLLDLSAFVSASIGSGDYPIVRYQVDGGSWTETQLTSSTAFVNITGLSNATHALRFEYVSNTQYTDNWTTPVNALKITRVIVDDGATLQMPTILNKSLRVDGDSITQGILSFSSSGTAAGGRNYLDYAYLLAQSLDAELSQVGYGLQGMLGGGNGNVPSYPNAAGFYYNGVSRLSGGTLPQPPDYWIVNQGTNDSGDITAAYTSRIVQMRAEAGSTTQLYLLVPFNQSHKAQITAAYNAYIAAHPLDNRVHLLDLGAISYSTTDGLHPNAAGHQTLATALLTAFNATLPVAISAVSAAPSETNAAISWTTDMAANSQVEYGTTSIYGSTTTLDTNPVTSHTVNLAGLTAGTTYHYRVLSAAGVNNASTSSDYTFTTTAAPVVSIPTVTPPSQSGYVSGGGGSGMPAPQTPLPSCMNNEVFSSATGQRCSSSMPHTAISTLFTMNLQFGSKNIQVKQLQQYLNSKGYIVSLIGPGSKGNETTQFGTATKAQLIKFQKDHGIKPASGYFGPITRAYIATH